ncbi:hypothetical protein [Roseimicrobium sp. ORNL1]|uniref:hypothetical protein n=1 Tax=Roseimicrobium sp. ORNL1 TaxID=2711231 RepID=UPI0013E1D6E6|nr:hypothetical protein [Roseimicrobium sp. ORNL1]QIF01964.1 hypothetical protein G5S37_10625 [Roseimicrobium sp. ORNL1]
MSRRTKLIITALFLVLLVIPVVYVILSWNPHEPWRARLVAVQDHQGGEKKEVVIEVENISSVPLCIYIATLDGPGVPPEQSFPLLLEPLGPTAPSPPELGGQYSLHVPPREVQRLHVSVSMADLETVPASARSVDLLWASGTKHRTIAGLLWLQRHLPSSSEDYVPFPSLGGSTLALDIGESASQTLVHHK